MNQNIINNIILLIIIIVIIKQVSPDPDSILFILQKYINYFTYQIKKLFAKFGIGYIEDFINTFHSIPTFNKTTPSFKTTEENNFIEFYKNKNKDICKNDIMKIYNFLKSLISIDTDYYFSTPSDPTENSFTTDELNKIKDIILKKLNNNKFNFNNIQFEYEPKYYLNLSGKEIDPFIIKVDSDIGPLRIYFIIAIRNDIFQDTEYLVINEIKPLKDKQVLFSNKNTVSIIDNKDMVSNNSNAFTNIKSINYDPISDNSIVSSNISFDYGNISDNSITSSSNINYRNVNNNITSSSNFNYENISDNNITSSSNFNYGNISDNNITSSSNFNYGNISDNELSL